MLRHSVPHFLPNSGGIAYWVAELNAPLSLDTRTERNGNINLSITNISSPRVGIEPTTNRFYSHIFCPCATTGLIVICRFSFHLNKTKLLRFPSLYSYWAHCLACRWTRRVEAVFETICKLSVLRLPNENIENRKIWRIGGFEILWVYF